MPKRCNFLQVIFLVLIFFASSTIAQEASEETEETEEAAKPSKFKDPEDGKFDVSQMLLESLAGFMPIPIIITEPAIDNGLGLAGAFFHKPKDDQMQPGQNMILPNISVLAGAYTGNESWFVGGGHLRNWSKDRFRYNVLAGYANINLDWYGNGILPIPEDGLSYLIEGAMLDQTFLVRIAESRWYMGAALRIVSNSVKFDLGLPIGLDPIENKIVGASAVFLYENLDFRLGPRKGFQAEVKGTVHHEAIGSDYDFEELRWELRQYFKLGEKFFLSWRFDGATTSGDVPFYMEPFVDLQGIAALRYQGPTAATFELRGGMDITPRWSILAFAGAGRTADSLSDLFSADGYSAYGGGFRYLIARKLGMRVGIDIAKGPDETYGYLIVGADW